MRRAAPRHWREALMEAAGLGLFMVSAGLFATLLEAPASPLRGGLADPLLRRALMGIAMGATAIGLIYSPWGRRSGAHLNPAVTWTFWRLGKVERADALLYPLAQLAGGLGGVLLAAALAGDSFTAPPVDWVTTRPGPRGVGVAFAAEAAISALMMGAVLALSNRERWRRLTGLAAGALIALYITFEAPLSGMSLNPARTLASAIPAGDYSALWVYLAAPLAGMLLAAEVYLRLPAARPVRCAKLHHDDRSPCPFRCGYCQHETEKA